MEGSKDHILLGVAGNPVLHSKSPLMFNALFKEKNIDGSYIRVAGRTPGEIVKLFKDLDFRGMNITAPFKNSIIPFTGRLEESADKTGSVNTLVMHDGLLTGHNTDIFGITESLKAHCQDMEGKNVVVAGAGGAGISAAYAMIKQKCRVTILNRTVEKARQAAECLGCGYDSLDRISYHLSEADIFIPALPHEAPVLNIDSIRKDAVIFDASYKKSHYREEASRLGIQFIEGEKWLLHQAVPAFRIFCSMEPDISVMEKSLSLSRSAENIALIGFMGSGKSTAGRLLAEMTGREFIDTDELIEKTSGSSISSIFRDHGEEHFRKLEEKAFQSLEGRKNLVISCGGGAVISLKNREFLKDNAITVWLYCGIRESLNRIPSGTRPLLDREDSAERAAEIFNSRKHIYAASCDLLVSSDRTEEETAEIIYEEIRLSV